MIKTKLENAMEKSEKLKELSYVNFKFKILFVNYFLLDCDTCQIHFVFAMYLAVYKRHYLTFFVGLLITLRASYYSIF